MSFDPGQVVRILDEHGVDYVLIGGYAAQLHGATRPTTDMDITPDTALDNLGRLASALRSLGARVRVEGLPEGLPFNADARSLSAMRMLNLRTDFGDVDLTFHPAGTEGLCRPGRYGGGPLAGHRHDPAWPRCRTSSDPRRPPPAHLFRSPANARRLLDAYAEHLEGGAEPRELDRS